MEDNKQFVRTWYNSPLFVAVVTIVLTLVVTQVSAWIEREIDKKERSEALKVAFQGEINAIRGALRGPARTAFKAWKEGKLLKEYSLAYPKTIFSSNAGRLGELRDATLVKQLVNTYTMLERTEEIGRRIKSETYSSTAFIDYVAALIVGFNSAVILDMRLSEQTKHLKDEGWSVVVSEQDAEDRNFSMEALEQLLNKKKFLEESR